MLGGLLEDDGEYEVEFASDGNAALAAMDGSMPDIILTDLVMPGMDGLDLCRSIKEDERTKDIPVVFLSAKSEMGDMLSG